jgi:hypothetical protein
MDFNPNLAELNFAAFKVVELVVLDLIFLFQDVSRWKSREMVRD